MYEPILKSIERGTHNYIYCCNADRVRSLEHYWIQCKCLQEKDQGTTLEALDVMAEVLARYGSLLSSQHVLIQDTLLKQLRHTRPAVRKRAIHALGMCRWPVCS